VVFYIDDVQLLYYKDNEAEAQALLTGIKGAYKLHDLGDIKWFLRVRVVRDQAAKKIWLAYNTYIKKVAKRFNLINRKCLSTPLPFFELKKNTGKAYNQAISRKGRISTIYSDYNSTRHYLCGFTALSLPN
jgi:hypothetical protein